jgi:hypothetical protein
MILILKRLILNYLAFLESDDFFNFINNFIDTWIEINKIYNEILNITDQEERAKKTLEYNQLISKIELYSKDLFDIQAVLFDQNKHNQIFNYLTKERLINFIDSALI